MLETIEIVRVRSASSNGARMAPPGKRQKMNDSSREFRLGSALYGHSLGGRGRKCQGHGTQRGGRKMRNSRTKGYTKDWGQDCLAGTFKRGRSGNLSQQGEVSKCGIQGRKNIEANDESSIAAWRGSRREYEEASSPLGVYSKFFPF